MLSVREAIYFVGGAQTADARADVEQGQQAQSKVAGRYYRADGRAGGRAGKLCSQLNVRKRALSRTWGRGRDGRGRYDVRAAQGKQSLQEKDYILLHATSSLIELSASLRDAGQAEPAGL